MERTDLSTHRILLLGAKARGIQLLRVVLGIAGVSELVLVEDTGRALELLSDEQFTAVFCALGIEEETHFLVSARRRDAMVNPMIPIFVLQSQARRRHVERARDNGATGVLTTPISARTVATKLKIALQSPRPFILSPAFFGPDRRAKSRPAYCGRDRRKRAPKKTKVDFVQV